MKKRFYSIMLCSVLLLSGGKVFAADHPEGSINFYNASDKNVTAKVSSIGKISLAAKEKRNIVYSKLLMACSGSPTSCKAEFYIDDKSVGTATMNVVTGKLIDMKFTTKNVRVSRDSEQVVRNVVIT